MDGQAVVVALDARCVERAQEDAVGAHERSRDHGDVRVGLLDRRIGGAQQRGVAGGLFGAGEELFVGVVGLVPDLDRGKVRPVALGQVGDERRVLVRVARRIAVGSRVDPLAAAQHSRRRGRGPAGRAVHEQDHADVVSRGVADQAVEIGDRAGVGRRG